MCILLALILITVVSCNPTKYVPEGESLLENNHIAVSKERIKSTDLVPYIKQTPNKRIFGTRFHLGLYNLANIKKEKWPHTWLRNIGEEPVIYDQFSTDKSRDQIKSFVDSKGYFDGVVTDTVHTVNRRSDVYYNIELKRPYSIRNLKYEIADTNIRNLCYFDSVNCLITRGKAYDVDMLQAERMRFERFIRDHGFYGFSSDFVSFLVDSTVGNRQVDIKYIVKEFETVDASSRIVSGPYAVYSVKNIYIYPDFDPKEALEGGDNYLRSLDTTFYNGYYFVTHKTSRAVKYDLILQAVYLKAGSVFNISSTEQTQEHLQGLKIYRLVNIFYNDAKENAELHGMELKLDCNIQLTLLSIQGYKVELEGTNSAGNLGGAVNLIYQHKNLFRGAELFSTKLKGAYSTYAKKDRAVSSTEEYGVESTLRLPKFMVPFVRLEGFVKKYNPSTNLVVSYNYQKLPIYTRTIANATYGFSWKVPNYSEHILNPVQFNIVKLPQSSLDPVFLASIQKSRYLTSGYMDVLILGGNYSYIYNNQKIKNSRDFIFMRFNMETSGNFLYTLYRMAGASQKSDSTKTLSGPQKSDIISRSYHLFNQPFAQYVKADIDFRYNYRFNPFSSVVYRGFAGVAIPYGNSSAIPIEKQYFGGGSNGIRAWQVRTLGPGSFNPKPPGDTTTTFLNETGDIKLEANAEYRFKLFWILEGALFLDVGNIWSFRKDLARPGSEFKLNKFYKDLAVGTGTGFRFDLKFVIARIDIGMKLRDPLLGTYAPAGNGSKWIFLNGPYRRDDFTIVLGIGYPF